MKNNFKNVKYIMEEWRNIDGFENYEVSSEGRVRSLDHEVEQLGKGGVVASRIIKGRMLKSEEDKGGYLRVNLYKKGKQYHKTIHRLVAKAFLHNENSLPEVNHKDENKTNNFVFINEDGTIDYEKSNLEWCTAKYNSNYGTRNQRAAKAKSKQVGQYTLDGTLVKVWESTNEADRNGFSKGHVAECCRGEHQYYKNYKWQYIN